MKDKKESPIIAFLNPKEWEIWLAENHDKVNGLWLKFAKKNSGIESLTYAQALDVALCFGWIDGQKDKFDDNFYLNKFTPRRKNSLWSKRNCAIVDRLIKEKRMQPAGMEEVKKAKADGRWEKAYDSPKNMEVPADFIQAVKKDKKAYAFFQTLNKANLYTIAWRLQTAKKPETRERRMKKMLLMLANGEKFH